MENIESNWNEMADDYDGFTSPEGTYSNAIEWAHIRRILPQIEGARVLDIGCGSGRFTRYFEDYKPSELWGLDISDRMLGIAREKARRGSVAGFRKGSADDLSAFQDGHFDFVFSSTTMHYVNDIRKAFSEAFRVLKPGGDLLLSLIHPLYSASYPLPGSGEWELRYQDRSMREYVQPWTRFNGRDDKPNCRSFHYTLADYVNTLIGCGFALKGVHEPMPPEEWKETNPRRWDDVMKEPVYLLIEGGKPL